MNLLYLSVFGGGLETNVRVLAPALVQAGHRVSVLYIHFPGEVLPPCESAKGFQVYHVSMSSWHYYAHRATFGIGSLSLVVRSLEHARSLARAVADIHSRDPIDLIEVPEAFVLPRFVRHLPYVMRLHASAWMCRRMFHEPTPLSDSIEAWMESIALRGAAGVSAPSTFIAHYIAQTCRTNKPIEIIPYPIDTEQFSPRGDRADPPSVLFVGRVEKRKGADVLMKTMPRVWATYPDCKFIFAGHVSTELEPRVAEMPPPARFLGVRPREELVEWYQRASLVALPTLWDNSPNTIYEAMACGTPVVTTRVGGVPELVDDDATGFLVPPGDVDALSDAILALLSDPARREQMGKRGREKAVAEYGVDKIAARTMDLYETAIKN